MRLNPKIQQRAGLRNLPSYILSDAEIVSHVVPPHRRRRIPHLGAGGRDEESKCSPHWLSTYCLVRPSNFFRES
ncbi:hypothetical protein EVAR_51091_1 [Eumeta japonica]|uniref:Uncharacterized protein n=1 Tax=Eumeta variegata TaxID=151549 RepID=A0A4C1XJY7_EUMVA|nr:hypothetical protein EVAR_51091_1 [Eumeta japonica]